MCENEMCLGFRNWVVITPADKAKLFPIDLLCSMGQFSSSLQF